MGFSDEILESTQSLFIAVDQTGEEDLTRNEQRLLLKDKEAYGAEFQNHLLDQYKLYVEMADRISGRRMLANSFFVGVHTTLTIVFTTLLKKDMLTPDWLIVAPFITLILLCYVWERVVKSYRQLNSGKYKVVLLLEEALPAAPYDAEWTALGRGINRKLYRPLTVVEKWVPRCFGLLYVISAVIFLFFKG